MACRHHIFELHTRHVWESISGKPDRPIKPLLKRFQTEWDQLDKSTEDLNLYEWPSKSSAFYYFAAEVRKWGEHCLEAETFPREDYRELLELTVVYLGGSTTRKLFIRKPGAHHRARFMHNEIYFLKMELMAKRFSLSQEELRNVHAMAEYVALFHSRAFLSSRIAASAPINDLKFLSAMYLYRKEENEETGQAAINSCQRHLWYLTQELVVLVIFDENHPSIFREQLAKTLFNTNRPQSFSPGKPTFPVITEKVPLLFELIGERSWLLFKVLKLNRSQEWMQLGAKYWHLMEDYRKARDFVRNLEVVNDCAERGIKLITDFKDMVHNEDQLQFLFQVVEDHRQRISLGGRKEFLNGI